MHGKKRVVGDAALAEEEALKKKAQTFQSLLTIILERRQTMDLSDETLELTSKLLISNPDVYSIWNYRRDILIEQCSSHQLNQIRQQEKVPDIDGKTVRDRELLLSANCIKRNPKSCELPLAAIPRFVADRFYHISMLVDCSWHHRQWILDRFEMDYASEFNLCKEFLKADQRNFHCWNYRRYLVGISSTPPQHEFSFAEEKILENFSNYSAFHHRSLFFDKLLVPPQQILEGELQIIENAVFTEPADQSAWWYFNFLLVWGSQRAATEATYEQWFKNLLLKQYASFQSLLEIEPKCKWVMTAIVSILDNLINSEVADSSASHTYLVHRENLLKSLCSLDHSHARRYEYFLTKNIS
jgi:geranylgeranyl transferase type-2 subunit alpha